MSLFPCTAPEGTLFSLMEVRPGLFQYISQCTQFCASGSSIIRAKALVEEGTSPKLKCGLILEPKHCPHALPAFANGILALLVNEELVTVKPSTFSAPTVILKKTSIIIKNVLPFNHVLD
jgi:hypothetical protein